MNNQAPLLAVDNISSGYGPNDIVKGVSFEVNAGEIVALVGHNGSGKSSTLYTLVGQLQVRSGTIRLEDTDITGKSLLDRVGRGLRLMPAGRGVYPDLTIQENFDVVESSNTHHEEMLFTREDVFSLFPVLSGRGKDIAGNLSGGQQQMLAFGLCLIGDPRCLLLDEPSIGLAPNVVEQLLGTIRSICTDRKLAALLVEQNIAAAAKVSDRIIVLNSGRVVFAGPTKGLSMETLWEHF